MKTFAEIVENQTPDQWHAHLLCLGQNASAAFAGCETGPLLHVHLVRERHYLLGSGMGKKPLWFPDTSLLLAVIDRDEPGPDKWLERFRLTFNALPLVFITLRAVAGLPGSAQGQTSETAPASGSVSRWYFAENSRSPEAVMRFMTLAAQPLEFGKNTLMCVDFADYVCALDGGGLIHVAKVTGRGCEQAEETADAIFKQLQLSDASPERAPGAALIIEMAARCWAGISLLCRISAYVKSRMRADASIAISAPLNCALADETFNIFLAVRVA